MQYTLFIDDERYPSNKQVLEMRIPCRIARSSWEDKNILMTQGCPTFISFDHDLGGDDTAMDVVRWMIGKDIDEMQYGRYFISEDFTYDVHSQNPIGAENIRGLLNNYLAKRDELYGNVRI